MKVVVVIVVAVDPEVIAQMDHSKVDDCHGSRGTGESNRIHTNDDGSDSSGEGEVDDRSSTSEAMLIM